jgi:hypothetical protein
MLRSELWPELPGAALSERYKQTMSPLRAVKSGPLADEPAGH